MKTTFVKIFTACCFAVAAVSCGPQEEPVRDGLIDREAFAAIMLDVQIAEGMKSQYSRTKAFGKNWSRDVYDDIFERHGISEEDFQETYRWYQGRPDLMEGIYEQVLDSLSKLEAEIKHEYANQGKAARDSTDLSSRKGRVKALRESGRSYMPDLSAYTDSARADSAKADSVRRGARKK